MIFIRYLKGNNMEKELMAKKYLTPKELKTLLRVNYKTALKYAHEIQNEMKEEDYFIPESRAKLVLTSKVKRRFGI